MKLQFEFKDGQWTPCGDDDALPQVENLYETQHVLGWAPGFQVKVFGVGVENKLYLQYQAIYLVTLSIADVEHFFYVPDALVLMRLLGEFSPVCLVELATVQRDDVDEEGRWQPKR